MKLKRIISMLLCVLLTALTIITEPSTMMLVQATTVEGVDVLPESDIAEPSVAPTATPTVAQTAIPTVAPTAIPTVVPTAIPAAEPTAEPSTKADVEKPQEEVVTTPVIQEGTLPLEMPSAAFGPFSIDIPIDSTVFPDANFRNYMKGYYDDDGDGFFSPAEIENVTYLSLDDKEIVSLEGIAVFTDLEYLYCGNNKLTTLDVSNNEKLRYINTSNNELATIILGDNTNFYGLYFQDNRLTTLPNMTAMTGLDENDTDFSGNHIPATEFTVVKLPTNLWNDAYWVQRQIEGQCFGEDVAINETIFPDANFRSYIYREYDRDRNGNLDASEYGRVRDMYIDNEEIASLEGIAVFTNLEHLNCYNNKLTTLDVSNNVRLRSIYASDNELTAIILGDNTNLYGLGFQDNRLTTLPNMTAMTGLDEYNSGFTGNYIPATEFTAAKLPTNLWNNARWVQEQIEGQNFGADVNIDETIFPDTNFRSHISREYDRDGNGKLDASEYRRVRNMYIDNEEIAGLEGIAVFTNLEDLSCENNKLTTLDVSNNVRIKYINANNNELTAIILGDNTNFCRLHFLDNRLTTLPNMVAMEDLDENDTDFRGNYIPATEFTAAKLPTNLWNNTQWVQAQVEGQCFGADVGINATIFPDAKFRSYVSREYDKDGNNKLDASEYGRVRGMDIDNEEIASLEGIAVFTNLEYLSCENNKLTTLDVSNNVRISYINADNNELTAIILGNNTNFHGLSFLDNRLTTLPNMVAMTGLDEYDLEFIGNYIPATEFTAAKLPTNLWNNTHWVQEQIEGQNFGADVDINATIFPDDNFRSYVSRELDRDGNGKLDASEYGRVRDLDISYQEITSLEGIEVFTNLTALNCGNNKITILDLSENEKMRSINASYNELTEVIFYANTNFWALNLQDNRLTILPDITTITGGIYWHNFNFKGNFIPASEFSATKLPLYFLMNTQWMQEQISGQYFGEDVAINETIFPDANFRLYVSTHLDRDGNGKLDAYEQKSVIFIDVENEEIASLKGIEVFTGLKYLHCDGNKLTKLDVSANKNLERIAANNNELTEIILGENMNFIGLFFANNKLTTLPDMRAITGMLGIVEEGVANFIGNYIPASEFSKAKLPSYLLEDCWELWLQEQINGQKVDGGVNPTATPTQKPPMHTHIYNKEVIVKPATCGIAGTKRMDCACGAHGTTSVIPATGKHSFWEYVTTIEPTAVATGTKVRTCKTCGSKETAVLSKLKAFVKLNFSGILPLQEKQSTTAVKVTMEKGDKIVSWKTSNKKVATVSGSGKITGKKAGTAKITVKLQSGLSKTFKVKVTKAAVATKSIKLNMKKVTLAKGKSVKLVASLLPITTKEKVRFTTSDSKVATVSSKGIIKAKKKGKATITVYAGKKKATFKVTVK